MPGYWDENFGWYDIDSQEDIAFYHQMQRESVIKKCQGCGRKVKIKPDYAYCNSCAEILERGGELPGYDPEDESDELDTMDDTLDEDVPNVDDSAEQFADNDDHVHPWDPDEYS